MTVANLKRKVVYIFERGSSRGGGYWCLVLDCGHVVTRKRPVYKGWTALSQAMFRPLNEKLAPRSVQCHYCGFGSPKADPAVIIKALGGWEDLACLAASAIRSFELPLGVFKRTGVKPGR